MWALSEKLKKGLIHKNNEPNQGRDWSMPKRGSRTPPTVHVHFG